VRSNDQTPVGSEMTYSRNRGLARRRFRDLVRMNPNRKEAGAAENFGHSGRKRTHENNHELTAFAAVITNVATAHLLRHIRLRKATENYAARYAMKLTGHPSNPYTWPYFRSMGQVHCIDRIRLGRGHNHAQNNHRGNILQVPSQ
jgi:hypothetical protein